MIVPMMLPASPTHLDQNSAALHVHDTAPAQPLTASSADDDLEPYPAHYNLIALGAAPNIPLRPPVERQVPPCAGLRERSRSRGARVSRFKATVQIHAEQPTDDAARADPGSHHLEADLGSQQLVLAAAPHQHAVRITRQLDTPFTY
jgi:hypothetical protein